MARFCRNCGKRLSILGSIGAGGLCKGCKRTLESELRAAEEQIARTKTCSRSQLDTLRRQERRTLLGLYWRLYERFESDKELEDQEIATLRGMQQAFGLSDEEVMFEEKIRPYLYVNMIRNEGALPSLSLPAGPGTQVVLRKGETAHFAHAAVLKEVKTVSLGYRGGSHGISFRIAKGVRYRVGAHRGHVIREQRLLEASRGTLVVTNKRLFLHPDPGRNPVSIPLNKILSYQCFDDGIAVYKEGREKPYLFCMEKTVETFGLCLGHLLGTRAEDGPLL